MSQRITIDPITRIEGHLRIDCEIEEGVVTKAWSSASMWRGIETILQGTSPIDAWTITQRICGVCTTVHALASVRAVEDALDLDIPLNAQYIRNIVHASHSIHDHIVHFYQLSALDWVDITSALQADPEKAAQIANSVSDWTGNSVAEFKKVKQKLQNLVDSGQLGIFANGYWGHKAMSLPPEINLICVTHYLQALDYQRDATRVTALLGGKSPHIQNLAVGGVANPINLDGIEVLNMDRLLYIKSFIDRLNDFIEYAYKVDVAILAAYYPEWLEMGKGVTNYLSIPEFPLDSKNTKFVTQGGYIENADLSTYKAINSYKDEWLKKGIAESSKHSWYKEAGPFHPWEGKTNPDYTEWNESDKYSWVKSPSFYDKIVQVGPLANMLCMIAAGNTSCQAHLNDITSKYKVLAKKELTINDMHSTMGRIAARAVRCGMLKDILEDQWHLLVANIKAGDTQTYTKPNIPEDKVFKGVGFLEAPRGLLSHWIVIEGGKIKNYQAVVPSTWNSAPRGHNDEPSPYEHSLVGTKIADAKRPLEVLRTVHSFDPCISCAVHIVDTTGEELVQIKVL